MCTIRLTLGGELDCSLSSTVQYVLQFVTVHRRCAVVSLCVGVRERSLPDFVCHSVSVLFVQGHFFEFPLAICVEGYLRG